MGGGSGQSPGSRLLLEIEAGRGPASKALLQAAFPSAQVTVRPDLAGPGRVVEAAL